MTHCQKNWKLKQGVFNGKCQKKQVPGCWDGYNTWIKGLGKCSKGKPLNWYVRRTGAHYNSISDTGPLGNPKANGFGPILFSKSVPCYLWLDNSVKHGKGPASCRYRCKGQHRDIRPVNSISSRTSTSSSSNVAPPFQSYESVLAVRKTMAYYNTDNYKTHKKWKRANCKY